MSLQNSCSLNTSLPEHRRSQNTSSISPAHIINAAFVANLPTCQRKHRATSQHNSKRMKRPLRQITSFCMATLAMTALSNAASVRGVAITRQQDLHEEDRHTPSVAPTTINDMFAQDLANSSDELPESWEDKDQNSISISPSQSVEREIISTQPHSSKANVIDLPPQETTLSAAAASLDLDSATNIVTPISTSSFPSPPRSPDTIRGNPATSSMDSTLNTYNISSRSANYELDTDQQNKKQDDAPTDDLDAIMMGDRSKSVMPSSSRKPSQVSVASGILSDHSSSAFDWSSFTTPSSTFSTDTVQGTSRAQLLDKFPDVEEAEESFEENHRIAAKLQAAADHARVHDEEQRARQRTNQTALEDSNECIYSPDCTYFEHKLLRSSCNFHHHKILKCDYL